MQRCPYCAHRQVYADRETLIAHIEARHPIHATLPRDLDWPVVGKGSKPPTPKRVTYSRWLGRS